MRVNSARKAPGLISPSSSVAGSQTSSGTREIARRTPKPTFLSLQPSAKPWVAAGESAPDQNTRPAEQAGLVTQGLHVRYGRGAAPDEDRQVGQHLAG
jgi:hypothetical protein